jgi:hypothetical protein
MIPRYSARMPPLHTPFVLRVTQPCIGAFHEIVTTFLSLIKPPFTLIVASLYWSAWYLTSFYGNLNNSNKHTLPNHIQNLFYLISTIFAKRFYKIHRMLHLISISFKLPTFHPKMHLGTVSVHLKVPHHLEIKAKISLYITLIHLNPLMCLFYKGQNRKWSHTSKTNNTFEHGVVHFRVEWNIGARRRGKAPHAL